MKKITILLLALLLLVQCGFVPVLATETENTEEAETTEATYPLGTYNPVPDVEFGSASITHGCRSLNGMSPLGGSDRILQTARAAFVYEANTQTIIYSYNPDEKLYPGTLSKLLTGLIAIEKMDLDTEVVFTTRYNKGLVGTRLAELKEEEELTIRDLVACVMVGSANDAARMLANVVAPNESAFVEMMNHRAQEMGCTNTHFTNCTGLDDPEQYTTARDMAKIIFEAYKNPIFREFFGMDGHTLGPNNRREKAKVIKTDNHLMYQLYLPQFFNEEVMGGMASYSETAGAGLACVAEDKGMSLIIVTMGGVRTYEDNGWQVKYYGSFEEVMDLLEFSFEGFRVCRLLYPGQTLGQFAVLGGDSKLIGQSAESFDTVVPVNVNMRNLTLRHSVKDGGLKAPIKKDDQIGTVQIWFRTSCITETQVYAMHDVKLAADSGVEIQTGASRSDRGFTDIFLFLGIACLVIIIPLAVYIGINSIRRAAHRARRRRRRASRRRSR